MYDLKLHLVNNNNCNCLCVVAAQFMFDRTRQPQMSAFFNEENDIAEEDESNIEICKQNHSGKYQRPDLSKVDEVRLHSCLEEIRNVIGDSIPEHVLINTVLKNEFNFNKALDAVLTSVTSAAEKPEAGEFCCILYMSCSTYKSRGLQECQYTANTIPNMIWSFHGNEV